MCRIRDHASDYDVYTRQNQPLDFKRHSNDLFRGRVTCIHVLNLLAQTIPTYVRWPDLRQWDEINQWLSLDLLCLIDPLHRFHRDSMDNWKHRVSVLRPNCILIHARHDELLPHHHVHHACTQQDFQGSKGGHGSIDWDWLGQLWGSACIEADIWDFL